MDHRIASARPLGRVRTATMVALGLVAAVSLAVPSALAQTPPKKPTQQQKQPAQQKKAAPQQAQQAQQAQPAPKVQQVSQLMYTPWTKVCQKGPETDNKQVCFVSTDGRLETGQPAIIARIIEPEGAEKRMQVVLTATVLVQHGTRMLIDGQELAQAPYVFCAFQGGCVAFYRIDDAVIAKLKKGKTMQVQTFTPPNTILEFPLSLANFEKAYDGAPIDAKALEAQQRQLQSELQKKAEEARKKLETQKPTAAAPAQKK
jgi:invasion protein IalB